MNTSFTIKLTAASTSVNGHEVDWYKERKTFATMLKARILKDQRKTND